MTAGIMLALMGLASSQIMSNNAIGSIEVTPSIEIVEIPSKFSAFRQVGCDKYVNVFGVHIFASPTTPEINSLTPQAFWHNTSITTKTVFQTTRGFSVIW